MYYAHFEICDGATIHFLFFCFVQNWGGCGCDLYGSLWYLWFIKKIFKKREFFFFVCVMLCLYHLMKTMYLWWRLCTLSLRAYEVRVTVGNSDLFLLYLCYVFQMLIISKEAAPVFFNDVWNTANWQSFLVTFVDYVATCAVYIGVLWATYRSGLFCLLKTVLTFYITVLIVKNNQSLKLCLLFMLPCLLLKKQKRKSCEHWNCLKF